MKLNNSIVFVIPVKNEEKNISNLIENIFKIKNNKKLSVVFIDDKSTDLTASIINKNKNKNTNIYLLERNPKKFFNQRGSALLDGLKYIKKKNLIFDFCAELDGDLSHDPKEIEIGLSKLLECNADITIGSKYLKNSKIINRSKIRNYLSYICKIIFSFFFSLKVSDFTNGFRIYSKKVAMKTIKNSFSEDGPLFLVESLLFWKKQNFKIVEFPSSYYGRLEGNSKLNYFDFLNYFFKMILLIFKSKK
ncbi:glycosyltransferase [Candidatus Pelagibacter ubique]|nr:glycosyltransferase [Candidatus Pelagibacter ubique]